MYLARRHEFIVVGFLLGLLLVLIFCGWICRGDNFLLAFRRFIIISYQLLMGKSLRANHIFTCVDRSI